MPSGETSPTAVVLSTVHLSSHPSVNDFNMLEGESCVMLAEGSQDGKL